jgi:hypothetical protein
LQCQILILEATDSRKALKALKMNECNKNWPAAVTWWYNNRASPKFEGSSLTDIGAGREKIAENVLRPATKYKFETAQESKIGLFF